MSLRPPRSTRTDTLFPYPTLFLSVDISNILFWRPPGNRDPSTEEILACKPFIERLIALVRPKLIACAGKHAAATLLGTTQGITRIRGRWQEHRSEERSGGKECVRTCRSRRSQYH